MRKIPLQKCRGIFSLASPNGGFHCSTVQGVLPLDRVFQALLSLQDHFLFVAPTPALLPSVRLLAAAW